MRRISFLGILVGGTVSYLLPAFIAMPLAFLFAIRMVAATHSPAAVQHEIIWNPFYYYGILGIQLACGVLGGYLAGVTARHDEVLNGFLSSIIPMLVTALFHALDPHSISTKVVKMAAIVAAAGLGGYLRARKARRVAAAIFQPGSD
jgi:hypothetical protein